MKKIIKLMAFDADDTLWIDMPIYREAKQKIEKILGKYIDVSMITEKILHEREIKNLPIFGFGAKGFTLSMIETGIHLTAGDINAYDIQEIIHIGKSLMNYPITFIPHAKEVIHGLSLEYDLMLLTKGDLFDQENKIARAGISDSFSYIEITSNKKEYTYLKILEQYDISPENFLMIGNSLRSDIAPVLNIGGNAVYIPYKANWIYDKMFDEQIKNAYDTLDDIKELPELLEKQFTTEKI